MLSLIKRKQTVNISQCIRSQDKVYYQSEKNKFHSDSGFSSSRRCSVTILNIYASIDRASKFTKQNQIEL